MKRIAVVLFITTLFSCSNQTKENVMVKDEVVGSTVENINSAKQMAVEFKYNDQRAFALMNQYFKGYKNKSLFPYFLLITSETAQMNDKGFPTKEESDLFKKMEDSLFVYFILNKTPFCYIGHTTRVGFREVMMYVTDTVQANKTITSFISKGMAQRVTAFTIVADPEWKNIEGLYGKE